jgi:hypothetical protein
MTHQQSCVSADHCDRDRFARSQTGERILNAAIVQANISESYETYLEIFDAFYAGDVEVSSETEKEPIRGRTKVRSLLRNFLVPLHVIAEVSGLSTSIRETPIPGDAPNETHSAWTLDLIGASGANWTLRWCTSRKWRDGRVVYERHYDQQFSGWPLTADDLRFIETKSPAGTRRPS